MEDNIIQKSDNSIIESSYQTCLPLALKESITTALSNISEGKALNAIASSIEGRKLIKNARKMINPDTIYIAKIPKNLEGKYNAGLLDFMTDSKTGENLGVLVNGKNRIFGHVRIEEIANKVDVSTSIASLALQHQLAEMTEVINDVRSRVIALQEGHDLDLYGSIRGMHQQMIQMRDAKDIETRKQLATNAITVLNETRGKIEAAIIGALRKMPEVPQKDIDIGCNIFFDASYLPTVTEYYDRIEELVSYYLAATQLLGYSYEFLGEEYSFEDIFSPFPELLDNKLLNKLILAENIYNEDMDDVWYKHPSEYMLSIKEASYQLFANKDDNIIELEISGQKLLEAME